MQAWSTRRAFPLPQGGRAASRLAPRARRARCASLSTRRRQRRAGVRTRAASKPCKQHAFCIADHQVVTLSRRRGLRWTHECHARAKTVVVACTSIYFTQKTVYNTYVGHAGNTTSNSPFLSFAGVDQQQLYPSHRWTNSTRPTP